MLLSLFLFLLAAVVVVVVVVNLALVVEPMVAMLFSAFNLPKGPG